MSDNTAVRAAKLDKIFGTPVCAVLLAIFCNVLWGSAFPFIKLGYRLFSIDSGNTASIFCFAGERFMLGSVLVLLGSILLQGRAPRPMLKGKYVSEGMIFAADTADGGCSIAFYGDDVPVGSRIH